MGKVIPFPSRPAAGESDTMTPVDHLSHAEELSDLVWSELEAATGRSRKQMEADVEERLRKRRAQLKAPQKAGTAKRFQRRPANRDLL